MSSTDEPEVSDHEESIEIKQNDKFFTRIMSKETSMANSSCRVYYGGASGAIPFMWESRPGTPKHTFADTTIPPLTPPPSYHSTSKKSNNSMHRNIIVRSNLFTSIFHRLLTPKRNHMSPSSSLSSTSSSSSCSSFYSSVPSNFMDSKSKKCYGFSCARSPMICYMDDDDDDDDDDGHGLKSPASTLCFDVKGRKASALNGCHGYHLSNMKNAVSSLVRPGSSG